TPHPIPDDTAFPKATRKRPLRPSGRSRREQAPQGLLSRRAQTRGVRGSRARRIARRYQTRRCRSAPADPRIQRPLASRSGTVARLDSARVQPPKVVQDRRVADVSLRDEGLEVAAEVVLLPLVRQVDAPIERRIANHSYRVLPLLDFL